MITVKQAAAFWRLLAVAASHQAVVDREAYRKRLLHEELGVEHMSEIGRTRDYDRIMHRLAIEAEDWDSASHYGLAGDRRMAALVADCATQVLDLSAATEVSPLAYIGGILRQSCLAPVRVEDADYWLDLAPADLVRLFQILDTHRRRLVRHAGVAHDLPLAYAHGRRWHVSGPCVAFTDPPCPRPAFKVNVLAA